MTLELTVVHKSIFDFQATVMVAIQTPRNLPVIEDSSMSRTSMTQKEVAENRFLAWDGPRNAMEYCGGQDHTRVPSVRETEVFCRWHFQGFPTGLYDDLFAFQ
ncbi:hypothetical protein Moror_13079 [Moniliophthora roreri MCA 2997]|uniref:Uncharacterized protein n=2 Tax=Moniliophthora roreri TaxID=221103 RepID=V2YQ77_MONRO|nr:hypothetical protein Moror_13079 [Moniliophthora roreri MCA 2997]KAI3604898.1 hypothetical protein WG66_008486 [Moniliophthora roreri]